MYLPGNVKFFRQEKKIDFLLLALAVLFTAFGLLMVYEASNIPAFETFGNKYHYVSDQFTSSLIGIGVLAAVYFFPHKKYLQLSVPLLLITILSLAAVLIPGLGLKILGARRWLNLGFISFQPSELAKLTLIIYLASWLTSKEKGRLFSFVILLSIIVGLVMLQPDLGTAIILTAIFLTVYFVSAAPWWQFVLLLPGALIAVLIMSIISPYRYQRLMTFFNPNIDPLGSSYHIRQILISLGSGGLSGLGLGASRQKYQYLPEATTDSIFAIIGEELGFLGTAFLIFLYLVFLYHIFRIVRNAPDKMSFLLGSGILAFFGFQIIVNLGSMVALLPLTGVPLPFISYGGSSLVVSLACVGIILNISRQIVRKK
ncbi:cell division protein FtsW [Candidatus Gottesmanbacteria bacterium RIFCSPLOWO2_02_FULL_42_29]|uniref:Probable peptidoglycan glycosyltransferase FtsW n=2 Tax=Candidatus Gottesmaniibacteriota TaxID=1752720 RepID=A0A1F6BFZ0_9BACT|nr:MAG: Cell division protein FtsW [Candidatus Gottesmanbacteria bacterium GW2011_GWA2_42_18]OGG11258.1 MAG: cell division protein FtsW [Candidatus Gottesmanbacteria bacterium RIFCSPHIGHO2_01_FULL_42_27]OGG19358.1 MAG: cell division protein FtsW [Candidatus Gottesmanbacteria bacterium RIFCSPHIGHO2_12_FULL_43_26]OGG34264.1 MAG: cell division protein FtsW [Candidatus Gottesmanbacteria bacterium RIFCSPLOWO2_12_FULL_42_10]OGG35851.1 MAG: cell division protein FtsW [Candidatus Gottesmanbacteria bact